ncbi:hypothetical protein CTI12_AA558990 [Artemisia annua]|uniref:Uncharacterized protein n=1 Tax=Artemisia annua TaxID=35608 RepID=A0A2U1KVZ4_ARTAN|nr:hypothetical protein CTI12_AA558990 [Artemisia annua]
MIFIIRRQLLLEEEACLTVSDLIGKATPVNRLFCTLIWYSFCYHTEKHTVSELENGCYIPIHHGYCCLDLSTERLCIARHDRFNEEHFPFAIPKTNIPCAPQRSPYYSSESTPVIPIPI